MSKKELSFSYINVWIGVDDDEKFDSLCDKFPNVPRVAITGLITTLWLFVGEKFPDGETKNPNPSWLAKKIMWENSWGDGAEFIKGLYDVGFIEKGGYIHNWHLRQSKIVNYEYKHNYDQQRKAAEAAAEAAAKKKIGSPEKKPPKEEQKKEPTDEQKKEALRRLRAAREQHAKK